MPAADGDRSAFDVSVTYRGLSSDQAQELIRQLEGLSLAETPSPHHGPNPYVVIDPPQAALASPPRYEGPVGPFTCGRCGGSTRTAPGEGVYCRNTACPESRLYIVPRPTQELVVSPSTAAGTAPVEPPPEPPVVEWGPVCRAVKRGRQSAALERCTQLRATGELFCARWHEGWTTRGRGYRSIDDLTPAERAQCSFSFA